MHASRVMVAGTARPRATVVVFIDDDEVGRVESDPQGRWHIELSARRHAWHQVSAAHVDDGVLGVRTEGTRFFASSCMVDSDCAGSERCDFTSFTCIPP